MEFKWTGLCVLALVTSVATEAVWTEWVPLGVCTAKPCNCHPDIKEQKCDYGLVREIRFCNRNMTDPPCPYTGGVGPSRVNGKCQNIRENCPGWSEWQDIGLPCNCELGGRYHGKLIKKRVCNNPTYMYESVKCSRRTGKLTKLNETEELDWFPDARCKCEVTTVPTTTSTTTTEGPDCGDSDYESYGDDDKSENLECNYYYSG